MAANNKDLLLELTRTNFKLKYKGSALGFVWVLIKPFLIFLLLFLIFSNMGRTNNGLSQSEYAAYLLIGLVVFNFFNEAFVWGMHSLLDKSNIILKVNFNRVIAVLSSLSLALINLVINLAVITLVCVVVGVDVTVVSFFYFVFVVITLLLLVLSLSLFTSIFMIRLRDLGHISELGIQLLFYGSAVFYPIEIVPEKWRFVIHYNPLAVIIEAARRALVLGEVARLEYVSLIFAVSIVLFVVGFRFFKNNIRKIAEHF